MFFSYENSETIDGYLYYKLPAIFFLVFKDTSYTDVWPNISHVDSNLTLIHDYKKNYKFTGGGVRTESWHILKDWIRWIGVPWIHLCQYPQNANFWLILGSSIASILKAKRVLYSQIREILLLQNCLKPKIAEFSCFTILRAWSLLKPRNIYAFLGNLAFVCQSNSMHVSIVNPILLHRNDTDCQNNVRIPARLISMEISQTLTDTSDIQHSSGNQPHRPKSRTVCNFDPWIIILGPKANSKMGVIITIHREYWALLLNNVCSLTFRHWKLKKKSLAIFPVISNDNPNFDDHPKDYFYQITIATYWRQSSRTI